MTAINMEAFESLTSQISNDEEVLTQVRGRLGSLVFNINSFFPQHIEALDKYDTSAPAQPHLAEVSEAAEETEATETTGDSAETRAQWRKARLESLEEDAIQAQIVIEKMSELSTGTTGERLS